MRMSRLFALTGAACLIGCTTVGALSQTSGGAMQTHKPGILHRIFGHRPTTTTSGSMMGRRPMMAGNIVGNKRTHVYHMPGDRGQWPDPKNRVYFRTEADAQAAGYHRAGMGRMGGHMGGRMGMGGNMNSHYHGVYTGRHMPSTPH